MKKLGVAIARRLQPYEKVMKWLSRLINLLGAIVLIYWVTGKPVIIGTVHIDHEPLLAVLTMVFAVLNQVHRWLFDESEFSPAYALALGYVSNFLAPVITQLIEDGEKNPIIYVYKPRQLTELSKDNLDRMKAEIRNNDFELREVNMKLKHARARDILTVQKAKDRKVYFDFPNTLTSIVSYVDYKIASGENSSSAKVKEKLTAELIQKFYDKVDELAAQYDISSNLRYCDRELKFDF